jgi:hypothetical protein
MRYGTILDSKAFYNASLFPNGRCDSELMRFEAYRESQLPFGDDLLSAGRNRKYASRRHDFVPRAAFRVEELQTPCNASWFAAYPKNVLSRCTFAKPSLRSLSR